MDSHSVEITPSETLLGSRDVATMLGMSREQVWRLYSSGRLAGYRFDRLLRFARSDVERFMAAHYCQERSGSWAGSGKGTNHSRSRTRPATQSEYERL